MPGPGETVGSRDTVGVCSGYFTSSSIIIPVETPGIQLPGETVGSRNTVGVCAGYFTTSSTRIPGETPGIELRM